MDSPAPELHGILSWTWQRWSTSIQVVSVPDRASGSKWERSARLECTGRPRLNLEGCHWRGDLHLRILGEATGDNLRFCNLFWGYLFLVLLNSTSVILYGKTRTGVIGVRSLLVRSWWTLWPTIVSYRQCCWSVRQECRSWTCGLPLRITRSVLGAHPQPLETALQQLPPTKDVFSCLQM